jgi:hypothetical protein
MLNYYRLLAEKLKETTSTISDLLEEARYSERISDGFCLFSA